MNNNAKSLSTQFEYQELGKLGSRRHDEMLNTDKLFQATDLMRDICTYELNIPLKKARPDFDGLSLLNRWQPNEHTDFGRKIVL